MQGEVLSAEPVSADAARTFAMTVLVDVAKPEEREGLSGYTDCSSYVGKQLDVSMRIPRGVQEPAPGLRVEFLRDAVDVFDTETGRERTSVVVEFLSFSSRANISLKRTDQSLRD